MSVSGSNLHSANNISISQGAQNNASDLTHQQLKVLLESFFEAVTCFDKDNWRE